MKRGEPPEVVVLQGGWHVWWLFATLQRQHHQYSLFLFPFSILPRSSYSSLADSTTPAPRLPVYGERRFSRPCSCFRSGPLRVRLRGGEIELLRGLTAVRLNARTVLARISRGRFSAPPFFRRTRRANFIRRF